MNAYMPLNIGVYPNPNQGNFNIVVNNSSDTQKYIITNSRLELISCGMIENSKSIDLEGEAGIYYLTIYDTVNSIVKKLIVE